MEQRISIITLCVSDLKKAREFYDALGWKVASEDQAEEIVAYSLQNMVLALYPWDKMVDEVKIPAERSGYSAFTIAYNLNSENEAGNLCVVHNYIYISFSKCYNFYNFQYFPMAMI